MFITVYLIVCQATCIVPGTYAQKNYFEKGMEFFHKKEEGAHDYTAPSDNIDQAIQLFKKAIDDNDHKREAVVYLLQSYNFRGAWTRIGDKEKKNIFKQGKNLGKKMLQKNPENHKIKYWYMVNLGRWGHSIGLIKAVRKDIAKRMHTLCQELIHDAPKYDDGGAYRILGAMNLKVPHIPLMLTWPSDHDAVKLLKSACDLGPDNVANFVLYAHALKEVGRQKDAVSQLKKVSDRSPRKNNYLPDKYYLDKAHSLISKWK